MSTDWREKEREFLTGLKADTGRDLEEWMRAIAAQNLPHRNDIIDWLRQQGFPFARASWLERVHHNAGRPIYCDPADLHVAGADTGIVTEETVQRVAAAGGSGHRFVVSAAPATAAPSTREPAKAERPAARLATPRLAAETPAPTVLQEAEMPAAEATAPPPTPPDSASAEPPKPTVPFTGDWASLDDVLAKAKAYRPLALHLLKGIEASVPGLLAAPAPGYIGLSRGNRSVGLIAISAKDIRLVLRLAPDIAGGGFGPVKLPVTLARAAQGLTHMAILTDARQIDESLINLVRRAVET